MKYRRITSEVATLRLPVLYTFLCLAFMSDYNSMVSFVNQDTLADNVGVDTRTIQRHINQLEKHGLVKTEKLKCKNYEGKFFLKNKYSLMTEHYVLIDEQLIDERISNSLKAFLVVVKALCINNTNTCNFTIQEMTERCALSRSSIDRYLNIAQATGYIEWNKAKHHIRLINEDIFIVPNKSDLAFAREQDRFMVKREQKKMDEKRKSTNTNDFIIV